MSEHTIYVFVRADLPEEDQVIQLAHAVFKMAALTGCGYGDFRMVALDAGSSAKAFARTVCKLEAAQIAHAVYSDSDRPEWGVTAISTTPLNEEQALPLRNYRLRRYSPGPEKSACSVTADGRANSADVAQLREHPVSNRGVTGENPVVGSINCS